MARRRRYGSALVAALCLVAGGTAHGAPRERDNAAAPTRLDVALRRFSEATGIALVYDARAVDGRTAPPFAGAPTSLDALGVLLEGTSLEYRQIDEGTVALVARQPPAPAPAVAAISAPPARVDEIIVTASYRAPTLVHGLTPAYSLDREVLELSGAQNVAEPILELPAAVASVSSANTALLVSAGGLNLADLRGLGPQRSLVLVNGRRFARTSGGNGEIYGVDLNAIPTALIDRIEVINQGAGPTLGTEAIAGAINIVTRDHVEGVSLTASGGISERGDAGEHTLSAYAGAGFADGRGRASAGAVWAGDPALYFSDRDYLAEPYGYGHDGRRTAAIDGAFLPGYGGSSLTPEGLVSAAAAHGEALYLAAPLYLAGGETGFEPYTERLDQLYNWIDGFRALPEIDRLHLYAQGAFELTDRVSLFGEAFHAAIDTHGQVAPAPVSMFRGEDPRFGDALVVPADHPDAPAGLRQAVETALGAPIDQFVITRRFAEIGPRTRAINRQSLQATLGARIDLGADWALEAYYQYGRVRTRDAAGGLVDRDRVTAAIDPARCAATPGCVPFNIFDAAAASPAALGYIRAGPRQRRLRTSEHGLSAVADGPLYETGAGEGRLSVGAEIRRDSLDDQAPDELSVPLSAFRLNDGGGATVYGEAFASADLPLIAGRRFVDALRIGADIRLTRWSGGGAIVNVGADLAWSPTAGVETYASALFGGRAPNIIERASTGPDIFGYAADPCFEQDDPVVAENCAAAGAPDPAGGGAGVLNVLQTASGNPDLKSERVRSRHFGVAFDVAEIARLDLDALRVTADWRIHRVSDRIGIVDGASVLAACYQRADLSSPFCGVNPATGGPFITRDPATGSVTRIDGAFFNDGEIETSGLDATLAYAGALASAPLAPTLSLDLLYSYTNKYTYRRPGASEAESLRGLAAYPVHQLYGSASLETGPVKTVWTVRRRGAAQSAAGSLLPENALPATSYVDAALQFRPAPSIVLFAGVENLFDKDLPVAAFAERGFYAEYYDIIGRRYFAGVRAAF